jgi:TPR repeat protein
MNEKNDFALVRRLPGPLEKVDPGAKHILSGMVADTLALAQNKIDIQKGVPQVLLDAEALCQRGREHYDNEEYLDAAKCFRVAAERGHPGAQYMFGLLFHSGKGVVEDHREAVKWYRKAAEQGDETAQIVLGNCYENGEGVSKDHNEAARWRHRAVESFRNAAERGEDWAQFNLAYYYERGALGLPQSYTEAAKWYRKAANQGNEYAQFSLAGLYEDGEGVPKDFAEAMRWYLKAAENGYEHARLHLSSRYLDGDGVERDLIEAYKWVRLAVDKNDFWDFKLAPMRSLLTEAQIAEAEARCREFYALRRSASQNESQIH